MNAGGSIKVLYIHNLQDRIGKRMVLDAEVQGKLKKGDVIV